MSSRSEEASRDSHGIKAEPQPIFTHHHSRPFVGELADEVLGKVQMPGPGEVAEVTPGDRSKAMSLVR